MNLEIITVVRFVKYKHIDSYGIMAFLLHNDPDRDAEILGIDREVFDGLTLCSNDEKLKNLKNPHIMDILTCGVENLHNASSFVMFINNMFQGGSIPAENVLFKMAKTFGLTSIKYDISNTIQCSNCKKLEYKSITSFKKCSGCKKVYYCDRQCQKNDWINHKNSC